MGWSGIKDYGIGGKYSSPERDEEIRAKGRFVPKKRVWTKERCIEELEECLTYLRKILRKDNSEKRDEKNIKDAITMMDKILDFMRYLYPVVQKNINLNIDNTEAGKMQEIWTICQQEENERKNKQIKRQSNKGESDKGEEC